MYLVKNESKHLRASGSRPEFSVFYKDMHPYKKLAYLLNKYPDKGVHSYQSFCLDLQKDVNPEVKLICTFFISNVLFQLQAKMCYSAPCDILSKYKLKPFNFFGWRAEFRLTPCHAISSMK